jgi:hypothetical protein
VDGIVKSTLAVRNVFGNEQRTHEEIVIQPKAAPAAHAALGGKQEIGTIAKLGDAR